MKKQIFTLLTLLVLCVTGAWANGTITAAATTDLGSGNTPRYVVEQAGVGRLMKNKTGSNAWALSNSIYLQTGSNMFALQTYNEITAIIVYGYGTSSGRTFSKLEIGTTTSNYDEDDTATGTGSMSSTAGTSESITITPTSSIAANSYVAITFSGNINIASVEFVYPDYESPSITKDLRPTYAANVGTPLLMSITADHANSYQWYKNDAVIPGATNSSYAYTPAATGSETFYCVATNSNATGVKDATSTTATVITGVALPSGNVSWTTNTSEDNAFKNSYSTEYFENLSVTAGTNVAYEANSDHCLLNASGDPEESVNTCRLKPSAASNNTLTFAFDVKDGYVFTPTTVSFVAMKQGTNGDVTIDAKWTAEGQSDIVLVSNQNLKRASSSGTYATPGGDRFTFNLSTLGAVSATSCGLVLTLNTSTKSYGIGDIQISGTISQTESATMTVDYATFSSTNAIDFSVDDDLTVYKVEISGSSAVMTAVDSKLVPANTGVILKKVGGGAISGKVIESASAPAISGNALEAATTSVTQADATSGKKIYVLNKVGEDIGFYKLSATGTLAAGKAYLEMPEDFAGARLSIVFDDETTGIADVRSKMSDVRGDFFNLAGQRVDASHKGIVIVNGKKFLNK